jgi:outer membrane protein assembly factor BamB
MTSTRAQSNGKSLGEVPELAAKGFKNTGSHFPKVGPVVTAGGLIFTGTRDRKVRALDSATGKVLLGDEGGSCGRGNAGGVSNRRTRIRRIPVPLRRRLRIRTISTAILPCKRQFREHMSLLHCPPVVGTVTHAQDFSD